MYHEYTNPLVIFIPKDTSIFLNLVYQFCNFFKNHTLIFQNIIPINSKVRFFAISNIPSYEIFHQLCCFRKKFKIIQNIPKISNQVLNSNNHTNLSQMHTKNKHDPKCKIQFLPIPQLKSSIVPNASI